MRDWHEWHQQYDDPASTLSQRLVVVQRRLGELLDGQPPVGSILSLCAGDGRDIVPLLADRPAARPQVTLVELDAELAATARHRAAKAGVAAHVLTGDAGMTATFANRTPVDLLMLCGIFGNISDEDIRATISAIPAMLNDGGAVIWTRGAFKARDLRGQVRQWFLDAGFDEIAFDADASGFGVGVNRVTSRAAVEPIPSRLFTFETCSPRHG